ncbi:sigma-70 family RNA polymerase sigma factor [Novosphingobium sp. HK4-1]|uniref:Sigma-70 family RNA polymerase sigma factor n=1 Tax=Novosphingobium mangrovi (ex Huang et al. 2023) TaxID=2976432 RepID=A0ABT2I7Z4_9SPHN|nr:sigma-70 family RNA polymerase sigma factor [Novosphingobium mangrovi (ex Huang et al. 2023)]MCT2400940.1 sigma-70 family RNA polymerase sigma factor [Novosphingobium mangrovi (ex Huang et al. 2023)]
MDEIRAKLDWFEAVVLPHQAALRSRLSRILRSSQDLDDTVSEVLTRAWSTADWGRIDHGRAYLFNIARNLIIDEARRDKIVSFEQIADLELLQAHTSLESQLDARAELRWLQDFLPQMPRQCRRVFHMRRVQEKSMREIAEELSLSVSTVEKHLAKAVLLVMRARWQREEGVLERTEAGSKDDRGNRGESCEPRCTSS